MHKTAGLILATIFTMGCVSTDAAPAPAPAPRPQSAPTVVVAPNEANTIFFDSFGTGIKPEWQQYEGLWEVIDGWQVQRQDRDILLNAIRYIQRPRVGDATIETEVRVKPYRPSMMTNSAADADLAKNIRFIVGAGVVFRMKDKNNFYMFRLAGEEGAVLGKMVDGQWFDLRNPRVGEFLAGERIGFRPDNTYRLKVRAYGSRIQCFINDEPVADATDGAFDLGQVGLVTFKTGAEFDFIKITQ